MQIISLLALTATMAILGAEPKEPAPIQEKTVRVVYVVSKDREVRDDFKKALEHAIVEVRQWYARELDGVTFRLHDPIVEVARSDKEALWFYSHENGANRDDWGFFNALSEAKRLLGAGFNDTNHVWVIYSDGPGDKGRAAAGVACLPEDDLLGLIGQHPIQKKIARWIGGLGHELGHAFGLPHPDDTEKHYDALMWAGFYEKYPDGAYFTAEDKEHLLQSPFFFNVENASGAR